MNEISLNEVDQVSGGNPIALVELGVAIVINARAVSEFFSGAFDGLCGLERSYYSVR